LKKFALSMTLKEGVKYVTKPRQALRIDAVGTDATAAGNLYIDGSYYTFSPELPKTEEELKSLLSGILTKPSAPRKDGKRICKCGMVGGYCDEHYEEMQQLYAKDVGSASLASAQLILMLYDKIVALERRIKALEEGR